jgi:hypothetical protein
MLERMLAMETPANVENLVGFLPVMQGETSHDIRIPIPETTGEQPALSVEFKDGKGVCRIRLHFTKNDTEGGTSVNIYTYDPDGKEVGMLLIEGVDRGEAEESEGGQ